MVNLSYLNILTVLFIKNITLQQQKEGERGQDKEKGGEGEGERWRMSTSPSSYGGIKIYLYRGYYRATLTGRGETVFGIEPQQQISLCNKLCK